MAKDPAFLFYSSDFLTGVQGLTMHERGQYITLLCLQHQKGHLTDKLILTTLHEEPSPDVMAKFNRDPAGHWFNARLREEIDRRNFYTESRRQNAKNKKHMQEHTREHMQKHMAPHMENENENENEIRNELKKSRNAEKSKEDIFAEMFGDELFISNLVRLHPNKDLKQAFDECYLFHSVKPSPPAEGWEWRQKLSTWLTIPKRAPAQSKTPPPKLTLKDLEQ